MRRDNDEFNDLEMDEADIEAREALVAEITTLYQKNLRTPTLKGVDLEKQLRAYLATADKLAKAKDQEEEDLIYEELDELDALIGQLRGLTAAEQGNAAEDGQMDNFTVPGIDVVQ